MVMMDPDKNLKQCGKLYELKLCFYNLKSTSWVIIQTDASNRAIGSSLIQETDTEGNNSLIYAVSRSLKSAELNYSTIRHELLAVLFAVCCEEYVIDLLLYALKLATSLGNKNNRTLSSGNC